MYQPEFPAQGWLFYCFTSFCSVGKSTCAVILPHKSLEKTYSYML